MLTRRGYWFCLLVLVVLALSLWTSTASVSLLALTLLIWFLASWLLFQIRLIAVSGQLRIVRELADEQGPVQSLWVGRVFRVRVRLCSDSVVGLPFVRVEERVPFGVKRVHGATHAEGPLTRSQPLEIGYHLHAQAPGRVRFDGVRVQIADVQGFFYGTAFVQAVRWYRIMPALTDAKGRFPTSKRHNLLPLIGAH